MSRFTTKAELMRDASDAWARLQDLLASIPDAAKTVEVIDSMSIKDFLAHRAEWGRMMVGWYREASIVGEPAVPTEQYGWNQLGELNAEIHERFLHVPLDELEGELAAVHAELMQLIEGCTEDELFTRRFYAFTKTSDLATYFTSATGGHYRSAYKHINKWWRANAPDFAGA